MPLAYCLRNKFVYRVVQPKEVMISYPYENDSNWIESLTMIPSRELPYAYDMVNLHDYVGFLEAHLLH